MEGLKFRDTADEYFEKSLEQIRSNRFNSFNQDFSTDFDNSAFYTSNF